MDQHTASEIKKCMGTDNFKEYIAEGNSSGALAFSCGFLSNIPELFDLLATILDAQSKGIKENMKKEREGYENKNLV